MILFVCFYRISHLEVRKCPIILDLFSSQRTFLKLLCAGVSRYVIFQLVVNNRLTLRARLLYQIKVIITHVSYQYLGAQCLLLIASFSLVKGVFNLLFFTYSYNSQLCTSIAISLSPQTTVVLRKMSPKTAQLNKRNIQLILNIMYIFSRLQRGTE